MLCMMSDSIKRLEYTPHWGAMSFIRLYAVITKICFGWEPEGEA